MIVFPRPMPATGASQQLFDIQRVDFSAPEAGGYIGGVQAGFPLWLGQWTLGRNTRDVSDEWLAFLSSLRGSQRRFLGRDFARSFPREYPAGLAGMERAGGGAFTGTATSWSQSIDSEGNARLTLNGMPAGLQLKLLDLVGFRWDAGGRPAGNNGRRTLARVVEAGTANAGGTVTVTIEPPVPYFVQASAQAHLDRPACVMVQVPGDSKIAPIDRRLVATGTFVSAVQDLRP